MGIPTEDDIAEGWIAAQEQWWAWEAMDRACRSEPELAWKLIATVLSRTESEKIVENLGAGPLEDLLANHGDKFIDRAESLASRDLKFRQCLSHTWQNNMSSSVWARVCRATGRDASNVHGQRAP
jgi:hypothetical protein